MDYRKLWDGRRYYSLDACLKHTFGEKVYKITLNGGMTCPNRDGHIGTGGCIPRRTYRNRRLYLLQCEGLRGFCRIARPVDLRTARPREGRSAEKTAGPLLHRIFPGIHKHLRTCRLPGIHLYGSCQ